MIEALTGKLLIAMPEMRDPRFERAVIYICAHSQDGAMGVIINKPAPHISFSELLDQLGIEGKAPKSDVHFGGPVEMTRGFILHSNEYDCNDGTISISQGIAMSSSLEAIRDIANGNGPASALLALGYSGWGEGQLEDELLQNAWLTAECNAEILFDVPASQRWIASLKTIGIDPVMLSSTAGSA